MLCCGPRTWEDEWLIRGRLAELPEGTTVIAGAAKGADAMAAQAARDMGMEVIEVPAAWDVTDATPPWAIRYTRAGRRYDMRAGTLRNAAMLELEPDVVLAFTDALEGGTEDCAMQAKKRGIPVELNGHAGRRLWFRGEARLF